MKEDAFVYLRKTEQLTSAQTLIQAVFLSYLFKLEMSQS